MPFTSITDACQKRLRAHLQAGDWALDATAGNGHDTLCLAEAVGSEGQVWAVDRQAEAVAATQRRLEAAGQARQVSLRKGDHAQLGALLPAEAVGRLRAIVFNLGYLPGGDKTVTTQAPTTIAALDAALPFLATDGLLAVVCYPGHREGAIEAAAVEAWTEAHVAEDRFSCERVRTGLTRRPAPFLICLRGSG